MLPYNERPGKASSGKGNGRLRQVATAGCVLALLLLVVRFTQCAAGNGPGSVSYVRSGMGVSLRGPAGPLSPTFDTELSKSLQNLILVAGHSVTVDGDLSGVEVDDDKWRLLDYQRGAGMPAAFAAHIRAGIQAAVADPWAMLVFSGGQTRAAAGPTSEARAYWLAAQQMGWFGEGESVVPRTALEEFATDSFENLLFALARFREITGSYPAKVTVVSFSFKRLRFETVHRDALRFPAQAFTFLGIDPEDNAAFDAKLPTLTKWESKASLKPFKSDPFGCRKPVLLQKRQERNPFKRVPSYQLSCPEISDLLQYCGAAPFPGRLPWDI